MMKPINETPNTTGNEPATSVSTGPRRRRWRWPVIALAVLVAAGLGWGGWYAWSTYQAAQQAAAEAASAYQTTTLRRSDLTLSISGTGVVVAGQSLDLNFDVNGTLGELNVQAGETVKAGDVLASLGDTTALDLDVQTQEVAVAQAEQDLADLQAGSQLAIATAKANLANAQEDLVAAQENLLQPNQGRCSASTNRELYFTYMAAQSAVNVWEHNASDPNTGYGKDYLAEQLTVLRANRDKAKENWDWCQTYTDEEVAQSQADLQLAQAQVDYYTKLVAQTEADRGVDPQELAVDQAALVSAQAGLEAAKADMAAVNLVSPMDGTVMAVNAEVGESVGPSAKYTSSSSSSSTQMDFFAPSNAASSSSNTLITIADLAHPMVQVNIDETDLENFAIGCSATVTFDALPDQSFDGVITSMEPSLVTVQSVGMVQGLVDMLDAKPAGSSKGFPPGMVASVEVTCQEAKDTLVVPLTALYEPEGEQPYVMVLNDQGEPEKRTVEVGLRTVASAAITSGLQEGEKVIISKGDW